MSEEKQTHEEEVKGGTSASNAPYDELCEGRHQAIRGLESALSADSVFGTVIHDALATDDETGLESEQLSIYEGCAEIREKLINDAFGPDAAKAARFKEQRLWFKTTTGFIHSAKPDLVVRHGVRGLIIEYKSLPGQVADSPSNKQLRDQVALAAGNYLLTEIDVAIVQPLVTYTPEICRYDTGAIKKAQEEMVIRVTKSNDPLAKRTAGSTQCRFCLARFTCKEYAAFTALAVPVSMSSLTVPVNMWTPDQRALFCERLPVAVNWLEECKRQIKDMIVKDATSVPGWKLADGSVKRPVNNPNELHTRFLSAGGTTEMFMLCVQISKGELETQIRAVTKLKGKGLQKEIEKMLAGITDEKKDAPSLEVVK